MIVASSATKLSSNSFEDSTIAAELPNIRSVHAQHFEFRATLQSQTTVQRFLQACGLGSAALSMSFFRFGCRTDGDLHRFAMLSRGMRKEKLKEILLEAGQFTEMNLALLEDKFEKYLDYIHTFIRLV